VQSFIVIG